MQWLMHAVVSVAAIFSMVVPATVAAAVPLIPIGGKVGAIIPCLHTGGYLYTVIGFGIGSGVFWYVPGTLTYLYGPPVPGKWVLGLAAPAGACGLTTALVGSSVAI